MSHDTRPFSLTGAAAAAAMQLSAATVADCWDAVSATHGFKELSTHNFQTLKNAMVKQADENLVLPPTTSSSSTAVVTTVKSSSSPTQTTSTPRSVVTPSATTKTARRLSLSPLMPTTAASGSRKKAKYHERQGVGTVVTAYQADLALVRPSQPSPDTPRCDVQWRQFSTNVVEPYRHLFTTLPTKAQALEAHLQRMTAVLQDVHAFGQGDLAPLEAVGLPGQDLVCNIGRICSSVRVWCRGFLEWVFHPKL